MPRSPRIRLPDTTLHVVQRGNNRTRTFYERQDYPLYLELLQAACSRYQTRLHAYVLMTNHVHLLLTSGLAEGVSRTMQYVASRYVAAVNVRLGRTGTLWEGRFRSSPVDSDRYLLACYRYIELNPVRAGVVTRPDDYAWSSFSTNSQAEVTPLVTPHPSFLALGLDRKARAAAYRALVDAGLSTEDIEDIRHALMTGLPAGSVQFRRSLESALDRPIGRGRRRRVRSASEVRSPTAARGDGFNSAGEDPSKNG